MIPREILKKVKRIEIQTRGLVNNFFGGEYHSVFKGRGMTFSEVREYQPGDDIRLIDWNVTARSGNPFIKVFEEERELTVFLIVDISASGAFGSESQLKKNIGAEIASVLGFSAIKNNDKVGLILFSNEVVKYVPPKKGKSHVLRVIRELLYTKPNGNGSSIKDALEFLMKVSKRRCVVFLLSDFLNDKFWNSIRIANRKHDLIGIKIYDPYEINLPDIGMIKVEDPETGSMFWIDTSFEPDLKQMNNNNIKSLVDLEKQSAKIGLDIISISTTEDYVDPLMKFFKRRGKKY
ncbi:uncharacterized protein METZ01_LOCUS128266 [marine metagenome]|jgi:uncharacterized protein (DUF58 family)|uniref:VWFA domain-containing protein n=1 Tax=marine metagenome TaxID=408172 RepID=A0A381YFP2_9ZZZZ|tara:strand:- start:2141 stop:3016 length:876 start_codon:yes stop_codon:yes gene_type:complete